MRQNATNNGEALKGGKRMNISAWLNTSKAGKQYLRLKFDEFKPKTEEVSEYTTTSTDEANIPF